MQFCKNNGDEKEEEGDGRRNKRQKTSSPCFSAAMGAAVAKYTPKTLSGLSEEEYEEMAVHRRTFYARRGVKFSFRDYGLERCAILKIDQDKMDMLSSKGLITCEARGALWEVIPGAIKDLCLMDFDASAKWSYPLCGFLHSMVRGPEEEGNKSYMLAIQRGAKYNYKMVYKAEIFKLLQLGYNRTIQEKNQTSPPRYSSISSLFGHPCFDPRLIRFILSFL